MSESERHSAAEPIGVAGAAPACRGAKDPPAETGVAGSSNGSKKPSPPPAGSRGMNLVRLGLLAVVSIVAIASVGSYLLSRRPAAKGATTAMEGMGSMPSGSSAASDVPGLIAVEISPERMQLIGVRTARVERRTFGGELDLVGFVTPDETRLKRVQLRVAGWVQQLYVNRTGERVSAGQPLLTIYSPELYQSESESLIGLVGADSSGSHDEAGATRERLRLLGVPAEEIQRLERERAATTKLLLRAPVSGTVLERGVVEGQYVGPDTPLFSVADLSRVWLLADVYEMNLARVAVGDRAYFTADAFPGRTFEGRVDFLYPTVSTETRTIKAHIVLDNRDGALRPGMYGRVRAEGAGPKQLVVPSEAVISTGDQTYVFVAHARGRFVPRAVLVGQRNGDWVQVLRGLAEGDTVVASASFLIDSESRLKASTGGMGAGHGGMQ